MVKLARGFGGGHGGQDKQVDPHSSIDQRYLKHYGPNSNQPEDWISKMLSPASKEQLDAEFSKMNQSADKREKLYKKIRSFILLDKVFELIVTPKKDKNAKEAKGYENLSASDRYVTHLLDVYKRTESPTRFTITNMLKGLSPSMSKRVLEYLNKEVDAVGYDRQVAEEFNPPKIHENSVFLYQSTKKSGIIRKMRIAEVPLALLMYAVFPTPLIATMLIGSAYFIAARASHFELTKRFVSRMDLLPHLEMVAFQKVGPFGRPVYRLVRIKDLEKVEPNFSEENAFWGYNIDLDTDLMYKDRSTGELFVFDRDGYWNWEGISHKLLY
jgi:hypothetical protein